MSKQTQIALDFGQEPQTPPPAPTPGPAASDGGGEAPARPYMSAGGVGVRIKAYKQTPTPQIGDLFGSPPVAETAPATAIPGEATAAATPGEATAAIEPAISNKATAAPEPAIPGEPAATSEPAASESAVAETLAASETVAIAADAAPELAGLAAPIIEKAEAPEAKVIPMRAPEAPEEGSAAEVSVQSGEASTSTIAPATKRTPTARRPAAAKQGPSKRGRKSLKQVAAEADLIEIPDDEILFSKQYYTMGEVSEMFRVNQSLLRFWETEFDILQPRKNKKGDRYFRPVDIKHLHLIYHLLRQKKYTIEGAKEFLKNNKKAEERFEMIQRLQQIKAFLQEMRAQL
ncbi:MAG TPA: MerR family transcriptional regulator [Puia sp.]|nr:MerR family transcriptional regulator [Puia sp.]